MGISAVYSLQALINSKFACNKPIEVINAGTEAYTLADNIERLRRDIVPLKPDMVISYHGYNGLTRLFGGAPMSDAAIKPARRAGPSALLSDIDFRFRLALFQSNKVVSPIYSKDRIMHSDYADAYRQLIRIARDEGFSLALGTSSMAVSSSSPRDVKDFYGSLFTGIDEFIIRNEAHNQLVRTLAATEDVPLIDTSGQLDGRWDDNLYLDLVHFTQAGNDRMAQIMLGGISPILQTNPNLRCADRAMR
jgi:lysophospholipase L1-like esterase